MAIDNKTLKRMTAKCKAMGVPPAPTARTFDHRKCEQCLTRPRVTGERFCNPCRNAVLKRMVDTGYLTPTETLDCHAGSEEKSLELLNGYKHGRYRPMAVDSNEETLEQVRNATHRMSAKADMTKSVSKLSKYRDGYGKDHDARPHDNRVSSLKHLVTENSILNQFKPKANDTPENVARRIKYKFGNHVRFCKLYNGFVPKKIESVEEYRDALKRAMSVEVENRAANYAYLKLLDLELEKFEKGQEDVCYCVWLTVVNEMGELSELNKDE